MSGDTKKLKSYKRIAAIIAILILGVVAVQIVIGIPMTVFIMAPLSIALLLAIVLWMACFLIDRNNAHRLSGE